MADFYGTVADFKTYHNARGNVIAAYEDDDIQAAILLASEMIDFRYFYTDYIGDKTGGRDQVREWPRIGAYDKDEHVIDSAEIPREVENATYEAALKHLASNGVLFVDYTPPKYKSVSVDGAVSVTYSEFGSSSEVQTRFAVIDSILYPLLRYSGAGYSVLSGDSVRV